MTLELDVDDSTELLYDVLESNDDIDDEFINDHLKTTVSQTIQSIYNNREEIAEKLDEADGQDIQTE